MTSNLVQHRGMDSVWDRPAWARRCDAERWLAATAAGALAVPALRRRSTTGLLLFLGSAALAWWAAAPPETRSLRRAQLRAMWSRSDALVREASEESFPASDPPAWTPMTGNAPDGHRSASGW